MAAKPPKPPGNFLKSLLNQHNNNKNQQQLQQQQQQHNEDDDIKEGKSSKQHLIKAITSTIATNSADNNTTTPIATTKKANCNCSNISIMHLFHEMKQEFPTIPDTIVAQCVNENCHQRENCTQMLKNELELNPVPAQSYPAKVLHPPNLNNNNNNLQNLINNTTTTTTTTTTPATISIQKPPLQQKPLVVQQKPPLKPIRPTRTAPLQPTNQQQNYNNNNCAKSNSPLTKDTKKPLDCEDLTNNENVVGGEAGGLIDLNDIPQCKQSIIDTKTNKTNNVNENSTTFEVCNDNKICAGISDGGGGENIERILPRQRPTTLNLNTQLQKQQQQQRQRLNIQLQQRFQEQRNRQPQNHASTTKPIRKAPLPPIAPKPSQFQLNHTNTNAVNSFLNDAHLANQTTSSPPSESEISLSVSLSTPSPTSSSSPNTTTHQPFSKPTQASAINQRHLQTKSPIRHRSVINLQPEPPYTRDFIFTPASITYASSTPSSPSPVASSNLTTKPTVATNSSSSATPSPTASVAGSQKSFTSVNLTLRPPVSPNDPSAAIQPSTIDITAGPGFSGASGGGKSLHYSSTSYDARLGYQQNFQITVTDECGIFSASRIRPHQHLQQRCLNQVNINKENHDDGNSNNENITTNDNNYVKSFFNAQQQQNQQQHQQQQQQLQLQQQHQQFHNNNVVALQQNIQNSIQSPQSIGALNTSSGIGGSVLSGGYTSEYISGNQMCLPPQQTVDASTQEILQRQKKKRDKLAAALREYKKRLGNVEQEINLLTGTLPTEGLSERLDDEIIKLRRDCQDMLRSSTTFTQPPSQQELAINYQPHQQMSLQQQPQPFPRQRITRPPPRPPPPRQTSLDIIQHHSQTSTPHTPPAVSLPNLNVYNSLQQQQQQQLNHTLPPYYYQQSVPANGNFSNNNELYTDHHSNYINNQDLVVDDTDDYDEYEEVIEPWECNMCTFRNHPQLNICETCENVRIIPGRLTNFSRALTTANNTNIAAAAATAATDTASASNVSSTLGLLRGAGSNTAVNNSSSRNGLNAANGNLEHDTNLAQQQLQHLALHT